jgi:hypothetical protein
VAGGAHVDAAFWAVVKDTVGGDVFDGWKQDHPGSYMELYKRCGALSVPASPTGTS